MLPIDKEVLTIYCDNGLSNIRLDNFLAQKLDISRNLAKSLLEENKILLNGLLPKKNSTILQNGDCLVVQLGSYSSEKQNTYSNSNTLEKLSIIYEDDEVIVIDKPSGLLTHKAHENSSEESLVDKLLAQNISLSLLDNTQSWRSGIVHRLDRLTSGVLVVAKNNTTHLLLQEQLKSRQMGRYYLAIIDNPLRENEVIERAIRRHSSNRLKYVVSSIKDEKSKSAKSAFMKLSQSIDGTQELIGVKLFSGRTHQIRVHLASINRHILGDTFYGFKTTQQWDKLPIIPNRFFLHAHVLYFVHPITHDKMVFFAPIPQDMLEYYDKFFPKVQNVITKEHTIPLPSLFANWLS